MAEAARTLPRDDAAFAEEVGSAARAAEQARPFKLHPVLAERASEGSAVTVAVVSPYPATRAGLRVLLDADDHLAVVAEAASVASLNEAWTDAAPSVIVVDPAGANGVLPHGDSVPGVVVLGAPPDGETALSELGERAWGYLPPDADGAELAAAVMAVHAGLFTVHPTLAARVLGGASLPRATPADAGDAPLEELTPRELEVLALLAEGIPNKTIARRLGISDHTVKFHVGALLGKLGASSRTEAVRTGLRRGLIAL